MEERAHNLLSALIECYIKSGQPIGSRVLSTMFELSPATIRSVLADLESLGFLQKAHSSSGRVPTPKGYRFFVDRLLSVGEYTDIPTENCLQQSFDQMEPSLAVNTAADLIAKLTQFAGVVLTPEQSQIFKHIEFIRLSEKRVLLIVVTPEGDVQNRILSVSKSYTEIELTEAANFFNRHFSDKSFTEVQASLSKELACLKEDISKLMQAAVDASTNSIKHAQILISGGHQLLEVNELVADMGRLRKMFAIFEQKTELMQLLALASNAQGVQIYIGGDSQLVPVPDVSIITAPYEINGKIIGTLGVVGPSRMSYERVIPIVDITARMLSSALSR